MEIKTTLDYITEYGCSIKTQECIKDGENEYVGEPCRFAYMNSISGRERLKQDYPDYYNALVMTVWGDSPTVEEHSRQAE